MPNMCPFEKKEKETKEQKKFVQGTTFVQFFMYCKAKTNFGWIQNIFFFKFK